MTRAAARSRLRPWRWFAVFFVVGASLLVPVAVLSLIVPGVEAVSALLTPGVVLLLPLQGVMADWPGAVNLLLGSLANGVAAGVVGAATCLGLRLRAPRRR